MFDETGGLTLTRCFSFAGALQEVFVGKADALIEVDLRFPAKGEQARAIHQFLGPSLQLSKCNPLLSEDVGPNFGEPRIS